VYAAACATRAAAEAIPGAELIRIEGMGHHLSPALPQKLAARIAEFV
jgi:pimeloyl-ACP methyl ester carboxylesterase